MLLHFLIVYFQVHDMMDDIAEQQDVAKEISEAISNPGKFQVILINRMNYITSLDKLICYSMIHIFPVVS